jgi:hypothetical protein
MIAPFGNPLNELEDRKAQQDIGTFAHRIYEGALADGASRWDAFVVIVAWFRAMFISRPDQTEEQ